MGQRGRLPATYSKMSVVVVNLTLKRSRGAERNNNRCDPRPAIPTHSNSSFIATSQSSTTSVSCGRSTFVPAAALTSASIRSPLSSSFCERTTFRFFFGCGFTVGRGDSEKCGVCTFGVLRTEGRTVHSFVEASEGEKMLGMPSAVCMSVL